MNKKNSNIKNVISFVGYNTVASEMGENEGNLRSRLNEHLKFTPDYELKILIALKNIGAYKTIQNILKKMERKIKND